MKLSVSSLILFFWGAFVCVSSSPGGGTNQSVRSTTFNILLPSDSTGNGDLAVRLTLPDTPQDYRYSFGVPLVVISPGGHEFGTLNGAAGAAAQGFAVITFLYPGGWEGIYESDGNYDYRGENCVKALRDVIRYALGQKRDKMGMYIQDVIPGNALTSNVGILCGSNGGPTATAALSVYGYQLGETAYVIYLESPTNDQTVNGDIGAISYDCDYNFDGDGNGLPGDDGKNPYYVAYDQTSCLVDFSNLYYDSVTVKHYNDPAHVHPSVDFAGVILLDNNQNSVLDVTGPPPCYDIDGNGMLDADEDYPFAAKTTFFGSGLLKLYFSTEVITAAADSNIFSGSWPVHIAGPQETEAFWFWRDSTLHFSRLQDYYSNLPVMIVFSETDHYQAADDHAHIQQTYDGFANAGFWRRLNPDYAYIEAVLGATPPAGTADNDAGITVIAGMMKNYAEPDIVNGQIAAVCEMADRTQFDRWEENLNGIIEEPEQTPVPSPSPYVTPVPTSTNTPVLYIVSMMHAEEGSPFHQDQEMFMRHATNLRNLGALLHSHGAKLDFGPDWTFIEAVKQWDTNLLTDLTDQGHGIHTHAHETQYDLGEVNAKLMEAGLDENIVANGGFMTDGPGGTNWVGYHASFEKPGGEQLFEISAGYKNPQTQIPDPTGYAFRPSMTGDWRVPDPDGPMIYLGSNMPGVPGGGGLDFETVRDWIDYKLGHLEMNKINTIYWHDSLHNYPNPSAAAVRMDQWESLLVEYLDPLVAQGRIEWKNFSEMADLFRQTEPEPTPTAPVIPAVHASGLFLLIAGVSLLLFCTKLID